MLKEQFYYRLFLIVLSGLFYIWTMKKMALYKPIEGSKKNIVMKIIGYFFILLALFEGGLSVYLLSQIQHPSNMIIPPVSPDGIVRLSDPIWGYCSSTQSQVVSFVLNTMTSLGLGVYFIFYLKSFSNWWKKIVKLLFGVLLYAFYLSATDFHYFDIWEWLPLIFFVIMVLIVEKRTKVSLSKVETLQEVSFNDEDEDKNHERDSIINKEDDVHFKPNGSNEDVNETPFTKEREETNDLEPLIENESERALVNKYCRFCGKKVDYEGVKYCKHCGKLIV